jgi:hypothetical protein
MGLYYMYLCFSLLMVDIGVLAVDQQNAQLLTTLPDGAVLYKILTVPEGTTIYVDNALERVYLPAEVSRIKAKYIWGICLAPT